MNESKYEEMIHPALNAMKHINYDEAIVIGSVLGKLKKLFEQQQNLIEQLTNQNESLRKENSRLLMISMLEDQIK